MKIPKAVKPIYKTVFPLIFLLLSSFAPAGNSAAGDNVRMSKTLTKSFKTGKNPEVELSNKYGQIIVHVWNVDSVKFQIKSEAEAAGQSEAEDILDRVDFDFIDRENFVRSETVLDRKNSAIKELWDKFTDFSRTVLSENNLRVDYTVWVPAGSSLNILNKFGDVFTESLSGRFVINLAYGDLKVNRLDGPSEIDLRFGKLSARYLKDSRLKLKIVDTDISGGDRLELESQASTLDLRNIERLYITSRNDKYFTEKIKRIGGSASFSNLRIEEVSDDLNLRLKYGELIVKRVLPGFRSLNLDTESTDTDIFFDKSAYYELDVSSNQKTETQKPKSRVGSLITGLADTGGIRTGGTEMRGNLAEKNGTFGPKSGSPGLVRIQSKGGSLRLDRE